MRLTIETTPTFDRNYKRLMKKHYDMSKLHRVIELIQNKDTDTLYHQHKDHQLKGALSEYRECHIESDWLLIYKIIEQELVLLLTRTGSHDELFR